MTDDPADLADVLFGPMPYSVWWVIGAVLVVLLAAAWVVGIFVWTLPIEVLRGIPVVRSVAYRVLRFKFSRALSSVDARHRAGQLDTREAFHEVSRLFRSFLALRTGFAAREMTASDFSATPLESAAWPVLRLTYEGQFSTADPRGVDAAVAAARQVVETWV